jgi:hypothetical protein
MKPNKLSSSTACFVAGAGVLCGGIAGTRVNANPIVRKTVIDLRQKTPHVRNDSDFVYTVIDPPNSVYTEARSINLAGDVVGYYRSAFDTGIWGFILHQNVYVRITLPGATNVFPMRNNNNGTIVGTYTTIDGRFHGFAMQANQYEIIDDPTAANTILTGVNVDGGIVGYSFDSPQRVVSFSGNVDKRELKPLTKNNLIWDVNDSNNTAGYTGTSDTSPVDHGGFGSAALIVADQIAWRVEIEHTTKAYGINDNNDVVGTYSDPHGFLLHDGVAVTFDIPGSTGDVGTQAFGIDDAGRIVGVFQEQTRDSRGTALHGFLAVPRTGNYTQLVSYKVER